MRLMATKQRGPRCSFGILLSSCMLLVCLPANGQRSVQIGQSPAATTDQGLVISDQSPAAEGRPNSDALLKWQGLPVRSVAFAGVAPERLSSLEGKLAQQAGAPLDSAKVAASLRQVYATGLFDTVEVDAERAGDGVALVFRGAARMFIGVVSVDGAKGATVNTQLQRASRLNSGTRFTKAKMVQAVAQMTLVLAENGYHESSITYNTKRNIEQQLVDVAFHVVSGPPARVGTVAVDGDPGMSLD